MRSAVLAILLIFTISESIASNSENSSTVIEQRRQPTCGYSSKKSGLIYGGNYFEKDDYPWMAVLLDRAKSSYYGGGVIITSKRVLTAAHCIHNKFSPRRLARDIKVLLGAYNLEDATEEGRQILTPKATIIHPDWNPQAATFDADIAIIELNRQVAFDDHIQPICLWNFNFVPSIAQAVVIGYGKSEDPTKELETIPKELKSTITSNEECVFREPQISEISSPRTFCFGNKIGANACLGDSGHSVTFKYNGAFYLRGLVSSSFVDKITKACTVSKYSVMTDVMKFKDWIENPSENYQATNIFNEEGQRPVNNFEVCGNSLESTGLIIGGTPFNKAKYPWMGMLSKKGEFDQVFFCGATLISKTRVVTVAGCIHPKFRNEPTSANDLIVTLGIHDTEHRFESGRQSLDVKEIFLHPDYNSRSNQFDSDIAVIKLKYKVTFNEFVQPICLWNSQENLNVNEGVVIGYGSTEEFKIATTPRELKTSMVSNEKCFLRSPGLAKISSENTFCAGNADGRGPCRGDSGNGFAVKYQNKFYLRGLVAASLYSGFQGCDLSTYIIYADVLKLKDFINEISDD